MQMSTISNEKKLNQLCFLIACLRQSKNAIDQQS